MTRKNEILSLGLNSPEAGQPENSMEDAESPYKHGSRRELGAQLRRETSEKFFGAVETFGETGKSLWEGLKRISREKWEGTKAGAKRGYESTRAGFKQGTEAGLDYAFYGAAASARGARAIGRGAGRTATFLAEHGPEWLTDTAGDALYEGGEGTKSGAQIVKKKGTKTAGESSEKIRQGYDWTVNKVSDTKQWTAERYDDLSGWAGDKADAIKTRAAEARSTFENKVDQAKQWYVNWKETRDLRAKQERLNNLLESQRVVSNEIAQLRQALRLDQDLETMKQAA